VVRRALLAGLASVAILVLGAGPAAAHAQLESTSPVAGAVLETAPRMATVRFSEPVQVRDDGLQLHDSRGRRVDHSAVRRLDGGRTIGLPLSGLGDGGYVLTWRVVSVDGHPISGGVTWRVGAGSADVDPSVFQQLLSAEGDDASLRAFAAAVRTLLFASLVVLVGGLLFVAVVSPDVVGHRRFVRMLGVGAGVAAVSTALGMGVQGADVAGLGLGDAFDVGRALDTLDGSYGRAAVVRLVLLAVLAVIGTWAVTVERARQRSWRALAIVASAATMLTLTLAGHARTGRWLALATPLDLVHLLAVATWLGGLATLAYVVLPREIEGADHDVVRRFSSVAAACVGAIAVTGVVQGVRQVHDIDGLRVTSYGRLLMIKVVVVVLVVVLGAMSRSLLRRHDRTLVTVGAPVLPDEEGEAVDEDPVVLRRSLRRSVAAEALVSVAVLALTSLLVAADPARTVDAKAFNATKAVSGTLIQVVATPARTGPVTFHLFVQDPGRGLTTPVTAEARLSLPDKGIPAVTLPLKRVTATHFSAYGVEVPIRGRWQLEVSIVIDGLDQRRATFEVEFD
jgi:copper transport protein